MAILPGCRLLLALNDRSIYLMDIVQENRKIVDFKFTLISATFSIPTCIDLHEDFLFVGSAFSDSSLFSLSFESLNSSKSLIEASADGDMDLDDLYADAKVKNTLPAAVKTSGSFSLILQDTLVNVAPFKDAAVGFCKDLHSSMRGRNLQILGCCNSFDQSNLVLLQRHLKPTILSSYPMNATACWLVPANNGRKILVLSNETQTRSVELAGLEIKEIRDGHFYTDGATIFCCSWNNLIYQVYLQGWRCLNSG